MIPILALALVVNGVPAPASSRAERAEQGGISVVSDEARGSRGSVCTYQIENGAAQLVSGIEVQPGLNAAIPRAVLRDFEQQPEEWFEQAGLPGEPLVRWRGEREDDVLRPGQRVALSFSAVPLVRREGAGDEFVCANALVAVTAVAALPAAPDAPAIGIEIVGVRYEPASRWLIARLALRNHGPDATLPLGEEYSGGRFAQQIELSAARPDAPVIPVRASSLRVKDATPLQVVLPHGGTYKVSWSGYAQQLEPGTYSITARYRGAESPPARLVVPPPAESRQLSRGAF